MRPRLTITVTLEGVDNGAAYSHTELLPPMDEWETDVGDAMGRLFGNCLNGMAYFLCPHDKKLIAKHVMEACEEVT